MNIHWRRRKMQKKRYYYMHTKIGYSTWDKSFYFQHQLPTYFENVNNKQEYSTELPYSVKLTQTA